MIHFLKWLPVAFFPRGYVPPRSAESNAWTKKQGARKRRQLKEYRALVNEPRRKTYRIGWNAAINEAAKIVDLADSQLGAVIRDLRRK